MADDVFVTQTVIETAFKTSSDVKSTQLVVEHAFITPSDIKTTQTVIEVAHKTLSPVQATQLVIEVIRSITPTIPFPPGFFGLPGAGIYQLVPNKRQDTLYDLGDKKIPNPFAQTTYIGS